MNAASADLPDREFADLCRRTDARAKAALKVGEVSGDRLRKGAAAPAVTTPGAHP